jgi:hypothetical protein
VAAGQKIASTWGNELRDRTRQVFATKAELDAQWPTAPVGAFAVTLDTGWTWSRASDRWHVLQARQTAAYASNPAEVGIGTTAVTAVTLTLGPTLPPGVYQVTFMGQFWTAALINLVLRHNGATIGGVVIQGTAGADYQTQGTQMVRSGVKAGDVIDVSLTANVPGGMRALGSILARWIGDF